MADNDCADCATLESARIKYNKFHVTDVTAVEAISTGFQVSFHLDGYGARTFTAEWRKLLHMFACDPTTFTNDCKYTSSYAKIPEEKKPHPLGNLSVPKLHASGDLMLSEEYCGTNDLDYRQAEKWPGHLAAAAYTSQEVTVHGWALVLELPQLPGVTFYVSPGRRDLIGDLRETRVRGHDRESWPIAEHPLVGRVGRAEVSIDIERWRNTFQLQTAEDDTVIVPWSQQSPSDLIEGVGKAVLLQGGAEPAATGDVHARRASAPLSRADLVKALEVVLTRLR